MSQHLPTMRLLSTRIRHIKILKTLWKQKKQKAFMAKLKQLNTNDDICYSIIKSILQNIKKKIFSIQLCTCILSFVEIHFLDSSNDNDVQIALEFIHYMLESFSKVIIEMKNIDIQSQSFKNITITLEDRKNNCMQCEKALINLIPKLKSIVERKKTTTNQLCCSKATDCLLLLQHFTV